MRRTAALLFGIAIAVALPAAAAGEDALKTTITGGPPPFLALASASFTFEANDSDARLFCALDGADFSSCSSPQAYSGLADGPHTFFVFATKGHEQEDPPASWTWTVDTAPPMVTPANAAVEYRKMSLTWTPSADLDHVVVLRSKSRAQPPTEQIYSGAASRYTDRRFSNARYYRYGITGYDRAGNVSAEVEVDVTPSALLVSPADRAQVRSSKRPPVLLWRKALGARYYNVQLWRGGNKVLSAWPLSTRFALSRAWSFEGHRYRLRRGAYTWFVWPSFRAFPQIAYGPLLGRASFRVS
jgi:hypothetical protein